MSKIIEVFYSKTNFLMKKDIPLIITETNTGLEKSSKDWFYWCFNLAYKNKIETSKISAFRRVF